MLEKKSLYQLEKKDIKRASEVLSKAFWNDPAWCMIMDKYPDKMKRMNTVFELMIRYGLKYGYCFASSQNLEGISIWVFQDKVNMSMGRMIRSNGIIRLIQASRLFEREMLKFQEPIEKFKKKVSKNPVFYHAAFGVHPDYQNQGIGSEILKIIHDQVDQKGLSIFLDTQTESNVKYYEKRGYKIIKTISVPIFNFPLWFLIREPLKNKFE